MAHAAQLKNKSGKKRTPTGMAAPKNGNGNVQSNGTVMIILGAAGVIMTIFQAFWGVAWSGVNANIDRLEKSIVSTAARVEREASEKARAIDLARIREHDRIEGQLMARILLIEQNFLRLQEHKEFTVRLDSQLLKMEDRLKDAASRNDMDTRLGINSASIIQVRNEIDKLKSDLGQIKIPAKW